MDEMTFWQRPDVVVLGGGLIGLTIALECVERGMRVCVMERGLALQEASSAAAGMLAAHDPHHPPMLRALAERSAGLYPALLPRLEARSGLSVPFQTESTLQYSADGAVIRLVERSIDPRQLAHAVHGTVLSAQRAGSLRLHERVAGIRVEREGDLFCITSDAFTPIITPALIHATGAWMGGDPARPWGPPPQPTVQPCKGQMLRVTMPDGSWLDAVHRSEHVYIVPRLRGPQAGTALIGATVEDVGFDKSLDEEALHELRRAAAALRPEFAWMLQAVEVERWAGLRPATPDGLPLLGRVRDDTHAPMEILAGGHYRNGILLAPATAEAVCDLLQGKTSAVDLRPFRPERFFDHGAPSVPEGRYSREQA